MKTSPSHHDMVRAGPHVSRTPLLLFRMWVASLLLACAIPWSLGSDNQPTLAQSTRQPWEIEPVQPDRPTPPPRGDDAEKGQYDAIIFQPVSQFRLSQSTYQVTSLTSLIPYDKAAINLLQYSIKFLYDFERHFARIGWTREERHHADKPKQKYTHHGVLYENINVFRTVIQGQLREARRLSALHLQTLDLLRDHPGIRPDKFAHPERKLLKGLMTCSMNLTPFEHTEVNYVRTEKGVTPPNTHWFCTCMERVWSEALPRFEEICPEDEFSRKKRNVLSPEPMQPALDEFDAVNSTTMTQIIHDTTLLCAKNASNNFCKTLFGKSTPKSRSKRFVLFDMILGGIMYSKFRYTTRTMNQLKQNVRALYANQVTAQDAISQAFNYINLTHIELGQHRRLLQKLDRSVVILEEQFAQVRKALNSMDEALEYTRMSTWSLIKYDAIQETLTAFRGASRHLATFMNTIATQRLTPTLLPPDQLRDILLRVKATLDKNRNEERLTLPSDPNKDIWAYYGFLRIIPTIVYGSLIVTLEVPLSDVSTHLNLYRAREFPLMHPELRLQFTYDLENEYIALDKGERYYMLPPLSEVMSCQATQGNWCRFSTPMKTTRRTSDCVAALLMKDEEAMGRTCRMKVRQHAENTAIALRPQIWLISLVEETSIVTSCLKDQSQILAKPPYIVFTLAPSCMAHIGDTLYLPPSTQLYSGHPETFVTDMHELAPLLEYHSLGDFRLFNDTYFDTLTEGEIDALCTKLTAFDAVPLRDIRYHLRQINEEYPEDHGIFSGLPDVVRGILKVAIPSVSAILIFGTAGIVCFRFKLWQVLCVRGKKLAKKPYVTYRAAQGSDEGTVHLSDVPEPSAPPSTPTPSTAPKNPPPPPAVRPKTLPIKKIKVEKTESSRLLEAAPPTLQEAIVKLPHHPAIEEIRHLKATARTALDRAAGLKAGLEMTPPSSALPEQPHSLPSTPLRSSLKKDSGPKSLPLQDPRATSHRPLTVAWTTPGTPTNF